MSRSDAIAHARAQLQSGEFLAELGRRVAYRTESQNAGRGEALRAYLEEELQPSFAKLDFAKPPDRISRSARRPICWRNTAKTRKRRRC